MLVAGIDSSTQSCKVLVVDAATGKIVRQGSASHPEGTEVHPHHWWEALKRAIESAGGLSDVGALSVGGQQHGMVLLDSAGEVCREALLWNDTRSAEQANQLVERFGASWWAQNIGSVPVASFTVTKLAWVAQNEPEIASRTAAVCLPHDWLTYKLRGGAELAQREGLEVSLTTDRGDASGTGYWSTTTESYDLNLVETAFGHVPVLPRVLDAWASAGNVDSDVARELGIHPNCLIGAGSGDNMAAALGLGATPGKGIVSLGTSGTVFASSSTSTHDESGMIAGFADATGNFLPLACTLNATQVLDRLRTLTGLDYAQFDAAALSMEPGAHGLTLIPYFQGERTPNRPNATGTLHGMRLDNVSAAHIARAGVEAIICSLNDALLAIRDCGVEVTSLSLIGGGAASVATQQIASSIFGEPIAVPPTSEYVALGMARQAAHVAGVDTQTWELVGESVVHSPSAPHVFQTYQQLRG